MNRVNAAWMRAVSVIAVCLCFTGCWDQREIEERTSVVAIAVDQAKDHPGYYKISVQIPIPIKITGGGGGQGGGGGGREAVKIMSSTGRTVVECFSNLEKRLNQQLFFGHTRVIAFGEDLARKGLKDITDSFRRDPELRRLLWPLVVKGEAAELLKANPELEQIPTVFIMTMMENGTKLGRIPEMDLGTFYIDLSSEVRQPYLNYIEVNGNDVKWSGVSVFRKDQMVGSLDSSETWVLNRIRHSKAGGNMVYSFDNDPEKLISIKTESIKVKRHFAYQSDRLVANINVSLEADLLGKNFSTNFSDPNEIKKLEKDAEQYLQQETKAMLKKLQHEYNSDILGIGEKVKAFHPDIWSKLDWTRDFPKAEINVIYDVKLRRTGMEME